MFFELPLDRLLVLTCGTVPCINDCFFHCVKLSLNLFAALVLTVLTVPMRRNAELSRGHCRIFAGRQKYRMVPKSFFSICYNIFYFLISLKKLYRRPLTILQAAPNFSQDGKASVKIYRPENLFIISQPQKQNKRFIH